MIIHLHKKVLLDLKKLLIQLDENAFSYKNTTLFGGSIGEHFRHIIEFYLCCLKGKSCNVLTVLEEVQCVRLGYRVASHSRH